MTDAIEKAIEALLSLEEHWQRLKPEHVDEWIQEALQSLREHQRKQLEDDLRAFGVAFEQGGKRIDPTEVFVQSKQPSEGVSNALRELVSDALMSGDVDRIIENENTILQALQGTRQ